MFLKSRKKEKSPLKNKKIKNKTRSKEYYLKIYKNVLLKSINMTFQLTNESLSLMKDKIEKMPKNNQIEILKILKKYQNTKLNENKSGIFVNLSFLSKDTLDEIDKYVNYVNDQETVINTIETQKQEFKNTFFA
jgi:hypothetical protein